MLDLVFGAEQRECAPMVADSVSAPLSWLDHHLIKCSLSVALPFRRELGPFKMVRPHRLLDPDGFQDIMWGILADLVGAPVNALVDGWYTAATKAVDMIATKRPLCRRAWPPPGFTSS